MSYNIWYIDRFGFFDNYYWSGAFWTSYDLNMKMMYYAPSGGNWPDFEFYRLTDSSEGYSYWYSSVTDVCYYYELRSDYDL